MILDILISLYISMMMLLFSINSYKDVNLDEYAFMNDYLYQQSLSLKNKEKSYFMSEYHKMISFNEFGNVFQADSVYINNKRIIIHLGNGYLTYE